MKNNYNKVPLIENINFTVPVSEGAEIAFIIDPDEEFRKVIQEHYGCEPIKLEGKDSISNPFKDL